jgi:four helix bundle protein
MWEDSIDLVVLIFKMLNNLPKQYREIFQSQMLRTSIPSNIAEGCSRSSEKDFNRFLEISLGSSFELETQVIVLQKLELINPDEYNKVFIPLDEIQKMINGMIQRIKKDNLSKDSKS